MRHPPLQAPLFWQVCLVFWIGGVLSAVWPLPGLCCLALLCWLDTRLHHWPRLLLAVGLALTALLLAQHRLAPPAAPAWLGGKGVQRVCGEIMDVQGLPDQRLRLLLANVRPERPVGQEAAPALPGLVAWTWEQPWQQEETGYAASASTPHPPAQHREIFHTRPLAGQSVCLSRSPRPMNSPANFGLARWDTYWTARNVHWRIWSQGNKGQPDFYGTGTSPARWREDLRHSFVAVLDLIPPLPQTHQPMEALSTGWLEEQGRAILPALLFGDRYFLAHDSVRLFSAATLVHSLALSGQHLVVAGLAGLLCIMGLARLYPRLYLWRPRAMLAVWLACPLALSYLWLGNAPASLLRATCMLLVLAGCLLRQQPRTTLDLLWTTLACICLVSPLSVLDTGLQLSALCVGTIGLALPWLRRVLPAPAAAAAPLPYRLWRRALRGGVSIFCISCLIQIALLPLNLLLFGNAGFWFPLNMLWLPVVDLFVLPAAFLGLGLTACGLDTAAGWLLQLAALPCQWLTTLLAWLDKANLLQSPALLRPHWSALPAFALLACALGSRFSGHNNRGGGRKLLLAGLVLLCLGPCLRLVQSMEDSVRVDIFDVGQGQAIGVHGPGAIRLLLDGGGSTSSRFDPGQALLAPALSYNTAPRLSAVLNSHPHLDHLDGLFHILHDFPSDRLYDNGHEASGQRAGPWSALKAQHDAVTLARGDRIMLGDPVHGLTLEVLHPPRNDKGRIWQDNDASLILRLSRHGEGLALFTGDAERPALRELLASGQDLRAQLLVAPHHGSSGSFLAAFYRAVQPELVVVSCAMRNRYGYPGKRLRDWLAKEGIPLLTTGQYGQIRLEWEEGRHWRLQLARPSTGQE